MPVPRMRTSKLSAVRADPHRRGEVRREADEPAVAAVLRRARLAGSVLARDPGPGAGAALHVLLEHVGGQTSAARRRRPGGGSASWSMSTSPVPILDPLDVVRRVEHAVVGDRGARHAAMSSGIHLLGAEGHRHHRHERGGDPHLAGLLDHLVDAHDLAEAHVRAVRRAQRLLDDRATAPAAVGEVLHLVRVGLQAGDVR